MLPGRLHASISSPIKAGYYRHCDFVFQIALEVLLLDSRFPVNLDCNTKLYSKGKISNDQELVQSEPKSCPRNQNGI